jgi:hypothetical protein
MNSDVAVPSRRDEYTNLTKAIVLPSFVHSYKTKGDLPQSL